MERHPGAKVLLSVRDPDRWYESTRTTIYELKKITARSPLFRAIFAISSLLSSGRLDPGSLAYELIWDGTFDGLFENKDYAVGVFEWHSEETSNAAYRPVNCWSTTRGRAGVHCANSSVCPNRTNLSPPQRRGADAAHCSDGPRHLPRTVRASLVLLAIVAGVLLFRRVGVRTS